MLQPKPKPATYKDILGLPPNVVGQIVFGMLQTHPRPAPKHGRAAWRLQGEVDGPFDRGRGGPGDWIFLPAPELHLGDHVLVTDIAGWKRERLTPFPDTAFISTAPDWLCEVLSPSTARIDRTDKLAIYATSGVQHCWYVDPEAETLEVFELTNGRWQLAHAFKDADPISAQPFAAHTFLLDVLWV